MDAVDMALETLADELASPREWVRLTAALTLDEADELARPLIPEMRNALKDKKNKYVVRAANRALNQLLGTKNVVP